MSGIADGNEALPEMPAALERQALRLREHGRVDEAGHGMQGLPEADEALSDVRAGVTEERFQLGQVEVGWKGRKVSGVREEVSEGDAPEALRLMRWGDAEGFAGSAVRGLLPEACYGAGVDGSSARGFVSGSGGDEEAECKRVTSR